MKFSRNNILKTVVILVPVAARAQDSRLEPGAVLVLVVLNIAVVWGV